LFFTTCVISAIFVIIVFLLSFCVSTCFVLSTYNKSITRNKCLSSIYFQKLQLFFSSRIIK
jgi:hypothetical protein